MLLQLSSGVEGLYWKCVNIGGAFNGGRSPDESFNVMQLFMRVSLSKIDNAFGQSNSPEISNIIKHGMTK